MEGFAISIGSNTGDESQKFGSIAIGSYAGQLGLQTSGIAIGYGAGQAYAGQRSINFNASGAFFTQNSGVADSFFVNPVRGTSTTTNLLVYATTQGEITYSTKSFVIDDPMDNNKYLVHACLEGPEAGVYYRGTGEIIEGDLATIELPDYVSALATNFTSIVTPIFDELNPEPKVYEVGEVEDGSFIVSGPPGKFFWLVYGERAKVEVEPDKSSVERKGLGPYTWIEKK
jgi:hypothetical protein